MSDEQRERDLAYFREWRPHVRAHDIPEWFADGAAYARATDPVRRFLAHPRAIGVSRHRKLWVAEFVKDAPPELGSSLVALESGATEEEACARALEWLAGQEGSDADRG